MSRIRLIGIDCATQPQKVGLARGTFEDGSLSVEEVRCGHPDLMETVVGWAGGSDPVVLALDAPLGWPLGFGRALAAHAAGGPLPRSFEFNRETDRVIQRELKRRPLDVGADRIGRTARSALNLLDALRRETDHPIPLAWSPSIAEVQAIEVYPAGTLKAHALPHSGYKRPEQAAVRRRILDGLQPLVSVPEAIRSRELNADELDAIVCLLAARDFLSGDVIRPDDLVRAQQEGWIWVRPAGSV